MNVREKAKNYEAFMSKSSSMEREKKRVREERTLTSISGPGMGDEKKMAGEGKTKPVPPPRRKKPLEKKQISPQLQHKSTFSMHVNNPAVVHPKPSKPLPTEKPTITRKPPPRPTPYHPSSPSLETKVPQKRIIPKRPSPVTRPTPAASSPGSPKTPPRRPPPPSKSSSLPRKPKPPVPPKPIRPVKSSIVTRKEKSATLPKTGSWKPENMTEDNVENVETKGKRSLTGPFRIRLEKKDEVEKIEKTVDNFTKDISMEGKGTLQLDTKKPGECVMKQTVGNTELEEENETHELQPQSSSLAEDSSENGEISNGFSRDDKDNRTLNEEIFKDDKESITIFKQDILDNANEKKDIEKDDIVRSEESFTGNRTDNDVRIDEHSERVVDVQNEDKGKEVVEEANEPSLSVSLENMDSLRGAELCKELPFASELSLEVEEKSLEVPEEKTTDTAEGGEIMANGHLEGDDFENRQSLFNRDTTSLTQTTEHLEEIMPIDMAVEDSTEKKIETYNEISCSSLVDNSNGTVGEDEKIIGVDESLEKEEVQQVDESAVCDENESHLSEETVVGEENSSEQDKSEAITGVEQSDVQQLDTDEILEIIPKEVELAVDEEKHNQNDSVPGVESLEEGERKDVDKDAMTEDKQCEDEINKKEEAKKETIADALQQNESKPDSVPGVKNLEEEEREETVDVDKDAMTEDKLCEDEINEKEEAKKETIADALRQNESKPDSVSGVENLEEGEREETVDVDKDAMTEEKQCEDEINKKEEAKEETIADALRQNESKPDSVPGVENLEKGEREETVDVDKDAMTEDKQCEDQINEKKEVKEETIADALQQNESKLEGFYEASLEQPSSLTKEENSLLQEGMIKTAAEQELSRQINKTQTSMEEVQGLATDTDQRGVLSSKQDVPTETDSEKLVFTANSSRDKDIQMDIEDQAKPEKNGEMSEEEILESVSQKETISSKTELFNQKKDLFSLNEPIRPRRPSRLKKLAKSNNTETETITVSKPLVESQIEENCKEEKTQSKPVAPYESVVLNASNKEVLPEPSQNSQQCVLQKPFPGYENVILRTEVDKSQENGSPSIYEVPRRSSFHSHTSDKKIVRISRSSSIGSLERKSESEYQVPKPKPRSKTVAEQTYVVPRSRNSTESSENDDTYVVPKALRTTTTTQASPTQASPVFESEYHVPQSLVREESTEAVYQVPPRLRSTTGSEEKEGVYSVPTSSTVHRGSRTEHSSGSEEEEGMYSVPTPAVSVPREMHAETERVRQPSECEEESVYSVPSNPVAKESEPSSDLTSLEEGGLSRSSRSSVLTSRNQLPLSFKHAPPKPPRKSITEGSINENKDSMSGEEDKDFKPVPVPIPRTIAGNTQQNSEAIPRVILQPKPRHREADGSPEMIEEVLPPPSPHKDQSKSSPKPKRPAPPRPKAPGVSPLIDKEHEATAAPEVKNHSAPPRPPPPYVNRTSFAPSKPESVCSSTFLQSESSESESEEEKPPEPTGPSKKKTCFIAHEILSTEKTFVNALTLCYEDCYGLIRSADVVPESVLNDIFKDLGNIYQLDSNFLQELEERMKTWDEHERIGDIVKKYGHFLKIYTTYINNYDKAMNVLQETTKENPQFAELVHQFQASEKCKGLFLISFMLKPVQRIPSYRLLLKDYLKHLPPESDECKDIKVALDIVSEVATHINESMKRADNFERVLRIQEMLVGNAEIVKPGRDLIKEGVLKKLCRKDMQERVFFLLTDVLLYTAPVGSTQYKLKEKLPLLGMKVTLPESPDFENEFSIISKMRSFTLSASTPAERDEWIEELRNAINALADKKKTFLKPKEGAVAINDEVEEESKIGEKAPVWIPDARVTMCMLCTDNFTVTNRRHHCRGCGKVVCGSCSDNLAPLAYLDYVQARVCEVCYDFLLKEQNKSESNNDFERLQASPIGMTNEDLDRIHRKPPKFEILHRFKPGNKSHARRKSKAFGRPSVCTEVVGHDSGSQMSGYLKFKRTNRHGWKRLWFVLKDNVLYTYKASEDVVAIETIPILGYNVQEATRTEDEIQFQLKHAGLPPITFKTESASSVSRWIQELKKATTL